MRWTTLHHMFSLLWCSAQNTWSQTMN
jgi:hypothetical protein